MSTEPAQTEIKQKAPPAKKPAAVVDDPWHPMDTAPRDGTYIYLRGDPMAGLEIENEWFFYRTRQFRKGVWQATGWWRRRFGPAVLPSFSPSGWRHVSEGMGPQ